MNQDIMIFDEATSMLDPEGTKDITDFIIRLNKEFNKTILTITHDLEFARKADEIIVMNSGEVMFSGTPDVIFKNSKILKEIDLDIPFGLQVYEAAHEDETLNKQKDLVEALWEYSLSK